MLTVVFGESTMSRTQVLESLLERLLIMLSYRIIFTDVLGIKRAAEKIATNLLNCEQK